MKHRSLPVLKITPRVFVLVSPSGDEIHVVAESHAQIKGEDRTVITTRPVSVSGRGAVKEVTLTILARLNG